MKRKPAWIDDQLNKPMINLDNTSRLRKLKKDEKEKEVRGVEF
jgi:hypothetical protein